MKTGFILYLAAAPGLRRSVWLLAASLLLGGVTGGLCAPVEATPRLQTQAIAPEAAEQTLFVKGQNLFNQSLYHEAAAVFGDFLKAYPQSQIKDLALLWLGRCHIRVGNVSAAEQVAMRLREINDTQFIGLYDEELRVARQAFDKAPIQPAGAEPRSVIAAGLTGVPATTAGPIKPIIPTNANAVSKTGAVLNLVAPIEPTGSKQAMLAAMPVPTPQPRRTSPASETAKLVTSPGPLVRVRTEQNPREPGIGGVTFYRLLITNEGKGVAKNLIVNETLPAELEFASSDPAPTRQEIVGRSQSLTFQILELKPGAARSLRIAVRMRGDVGPDVILKTKHAVSYQDSDLRNYLAN